MILQKMKHSRDDMLLDSEDDFSIITHIVDNSTLGGEYTVCGRAIPDSLLDYEGFEHYGEEFKGTIKDCDCLDCKKRVQWFKRLK